jgi:ribosomal protein S18 acetylase RimI-like enzyme
VSDIGERIADGMVATWRDRVRHLDGHVIDEVDGIVVCLSKLAPDQNAALVHREPRDASDAVARAEHIFRLHAQAFGIVIERGRYGLVDGAVREHGLQLAMTEPAMAIGLGDVAPPVPPPTVDLVRVTEPQDLSELVEVEVGSFDTDRVVAERLLGPGQLSFPNVRWYAAVVDGHAVAQAYTNTSQGAVAVFGVGTLPKFRRRGIGTAITAFAIRDAQDADVAWLMATPEGRHMYDRMGFRDVARWDVWVRR